MIACMRCPDISKFTMASFTQPEIPEHPGMSYFWSGKVRNEVKEEELPCDLQGIFKLRIDCPESGNGKPDPNSKFKIV